MYRFSDIDTYWRSRRLNCANCYIVRDIVVLSHDSHDLVQADVLYYLWIWAFFLYSSVLIVELINFLQNQPFLVKVVQKIISCE